MDAHLHTYAIRSENARRMAAARQRHSLHADALTEERPSVRQLLMARLHLQRMPQPASAPTGSLIAAV